MVLQAGSATVPQSVSADTAAESTSLNSTIRRLSGGLGGHVSTIFLGTLVAAGGDQSRFAAFQISYLIAGGLCVIGATLLLARASAAHDVTP